MPKPSSHREPDPMASVVDRLLAQLPGLQGEPIASRSSPRPGIPFGSGAVSTRAVESVTPRQWLGVWIRVLMGLALGVMMVGWPYVHSCGTSLVGYLGAIVTVTLSGIWAATSAWRYRIALAHVVALIVVLYGFALLTAELLPRTGYAADRASWQCDGVSLSPTWSASLPRQSIRIKA
jgi:hypothetical protein